METLASLNLTQAVLPGRSSFAWLRSLRTLDAIHTLASALIWQDVVAKPVTMITHDARRMMSLEVLGLAFPVRIGIVRVIEFKKS